MANRKPSLGKKSIVVHGPEGCGKTTNAKRIAEQLRLASIIDDWQPGDPYSPTDCLILTNSDGPYPPGFFRQVMTYGTAMQLVNQQ